MDKPDICTINVREYGGTYIARAAGLNIRASCTSGAREAAKACALKVFGIGPFTVRPVTAQTYFAERVTAPSLPTN